jgi:hypothetical protein
VSVRKYAPQRNAYGRWRTHPMTQKQRIDKLRAQYRTKWDAHQLIADQNARLVQAGVQPTNERLINEQKAAEAVQLARSELLAALSKP